MTCFIAHPTVCRSYAKCHGWQETLAHFFIKSRRSVPIRSVHRLPSSSVSSDGLSTYTKDQSFDSGRESSTGTNIDNSHVHIPLVPPRVFETSSSPDDSTQQRVVRQLDLLPMTDENTHRNLTQRFSSPRESLTSNSVLSPMSHSISMDMKDTTPEFLRRNSSEELNMLESITTPLQSSSTSREDLNSLIKRENSNDDVTSITSSNDVSSPLPATTTTTSIKHLCADEENDEQHRRLGPELRQILGRLIDLL
jgi:hypothetical protein